MKPTVFNDTEQEHQIKPFKIITWSGFFNRRNVSQERTETFYNNVSFRYVALIKIFV